MVLELDALRRTALILVIAGLLWNLVEAGVSLWAGVHAGSVALLAFGLDSIVELFAGGILVWRLRGEQEGLEEEAAERRAQKLLGLSFFLLAAYIALHSGGKPGGVAARATAEPCRCRDSDCKRCCDERPLRGQDAHRHPDAIPVVESGGHGNPVLRHSGPDHPGRPGVQRFAFLVVG